MLEQDAVTALCTWLRTSLGPDVTVHDRWPEASVKMQLPAVTVLLIGANIEFDVDPHPVARDDSTTPPTYTWRCGFEDWPIQVDVWTKYDGERKRLARRVRNAFRAGAAPLALGTPIEPVDSSVLVPLPQPWGGTADAWITSTSFLDSSDDTQRAELRALMNGVIAVAASVKAQSPKIAKAKLQQTLNGSPFP